MLLKTICPAPNKVRFWKCTLHIAEIKAISIKSETLFSVLMTKSNLIAKLTKPSKQWLKPFSKAGL